MRCVFNFLRDLAAILGLLVILSLVTSQNSCQPPTSLSGKIPCDLMAIESAVLEHAVLHGGQWPASLADLTRHEPGTRPFLTSIPLDPWQREYLLETSSPPAALPRVFTLGRDGRPGGEGADADVSLDSFQDPGFSGLEHWRDRNCTPARAAAIAQILP